MMSDDEQISQLMTTEYELRKALRPFAELAKAVELQRRHDDQYAVVVVSIEDLRQAAKLVFGSTQ